MRTHKKKYHRDEKEEKEKEEESRPRFLKIQHNLSAQAPYSSATTNHIDLLSEELLLHIFGFLTATDLCNASQVNHNWNCVAQDDR